MEPTDKKTDLLQPGRIDEILATEDKLIPSSGFVASVMQRVHDESRIPPPIPFPWKRAIPGFALAAGVFGWAGIELAKWTHSTFEAGAPAPVHLTAAMQQPIEQAAWAAVGVGLSLASWLLARRIAGRSRLI